METGNLTPKANGTVRSMRFSGNFGQPTGFGSVLTVTLNQEGHITLTLNYTIFNENEERMWSVILNNEQRKALIELISNYEPTLFERIS